MMKQLNEILGQERAIGEIRKRLDEDRFHGSFLFAGPDGIGKRATACAVAAELLGTPLDNHPDFFLVEPDDGNVIKIGTARELMRKLALEPVSAAHKVAIIDRAETLTTEAANAMLKNLEEPGEHTIFILVTSAPAALLPTIRSRCQCIHFAPLPNDILRQLLLERDIWPEETVDRLLPIACGSLHQAELFGQWLEKIDCDLVTLFDEFLSDPYHHLTTRLAAMPQDPEGIHALLEAFRAICRDILVARTLGSEVSDELLFTDKAPLLKQWSESVTTDHLEQCHQMISTAQQAIRSRTNPTLLWESVAFELQKHFNQDHVA